MNGIGIPAKTPGITHHSRLSLGGLFMVAFAMRANAAVRARRAEYARIANEAQFRHYL
jgi:hypothetical protein